jgi:hypothetical protein
LSPGKHRPSFSRSIFHGLNFSIQSTIPGDAECACHLGGDRHTILGNSLSETQYTVSRETIFGPFGQKTGSFVHSLSTLRSMLLYSLTGCTLWVTPGREELLPQEFRRSCRPN